ncbi:MAG TPA: class I SAM-dependent methyltransferase [Candidatus Saccharimonadales bacterium]|nr:class I SAM-dependent methyltransferase [Candidatus Saccharimonadales bacterium]
MNSFIESIYKSRRVTGRSGKEHELHSEIDPAEGNFIEKVISKNPAISKTLEIGCAYGMSSLHICHAINSRPDAYHIMLDPFQYTMWDGVGIKNLEDSGIHFFKLIETKSEFALPQLLQVEEAKFDLIFVDGWHTLDHTLLDCFYATRLLKIGGFLILDDVAQDAVGRVVDYLSFYPCYEVYERVISSVAVSLKRRMVGGVLSVIPDAIKTRLFHPTLVREVGQKFRTGMIALKKVSQDERTWDWFPPDF